MYTCSHAVSDALTRAVKHRPSELSPVHFPEPALLRFSGNGRRGAVSGASDTVVERDLVAVGIGEGEGPTEGAVYR